MQPLISQQQLTSAKRILYMTHLALGDYVYQGVWLKALKQKYPNLTIDIWFDDCRKKPQPWATGRNKILTEWLCSEQTYGDVFPIVGSLAEREKQIASARENHYDLVVFIGKNRSEQYAKIAREIAPNAFIVAAKSKPLSNPIAKWKYFNQLDGNFSFDDAYRNSRHITDVYQLAFKQVFGLTIEDNEGLKQLPFKLSEEALANAKSRLFNLVGDTENKLKVFVNHLSTSNKKDYPFEQLEAFMFMVAERYTQVAFVINTPPEHYSTVQEQLKNSTQLNGLAVSACTASESFFEIPALMSLCDIVVGVDTATSHFAVSLSKPQVTVMPTSLPLWQPLGDTLILEGNGRASSITPEQLAMAFDQQVLKDLNRHPALLSSS